MLQEHMRKEYYDLSQRIAEAIEAVLKIDVTIMDEKMIRIAGTGLYKELINTKIEPKTIFDYCFKTKKIYIIEKSGAHEVCHHCPRRFNCVEQAEICVPTMFNGRVIGVIGIIAFTEEQREKIVLNKDIYLDFITKMATLLEAKYSETYYSSENKQLSIRLDSIINIINEGLIVFNDKGETIYTNGALDKLCEEIKITDKDSFINTVWKNKYIQKLILRGNDTDLQEIVIKFNGQEYTLYNSITMCKSNDSRKEIIVTLQSLKRVKKKIIQSAEEQKKVEFSDIIGKSYNLTQIKKDAIKAAESDSNVLICGESGTGKELFARAIHNMSSRRSYPFIPINCGAIPDDLLESELFGHEKGAFTGAINSKMGKFEVADKGTIFLDEISEMPYRLQVKLLRVLQEKEICRIGSNTIQMVNVRIISATNTELVKRINDNLFREDLYFRLNIVPIKIPPLRKRRDDILFLADHFIKYYAKLFEKNIDGIEEEAKALFLKYKWPGNVRELQNVLEYAVNFETKNLITSNLIRKRIKVFEHGIDENILQKFEDEKDLDYYVKRTEKAYIEHKLSIYKNEKNRIKRICNDLQVSRATLYRKIKELNIVLE